MFIVVSRYPFIDGENGLNRLSSEIQEKILEIWTLEVDIISVHGRSKPYG